MNLYYIWQDENTGEGTYHAAVVAADDIEEARETHPCDDWDRVDMWCHDIEDVEVKLIGEAHELIPRGMVLASLS